MRRYSSRQASPQGVPARRYSSFSVGPSSSMPATISAQGSPSRSNSLAMPAKVMPKVIAMALVSGRSVSSTEEAVRTVARARSAVSTR
jgi:hypothetical protein